MAIWWRSSWSRHCARLIVLGIKASRILLGEIKPSPCTSVQYTCSQIQASVGGLISDPCFFCGRTCHNRIDVKCSPFPWRLWGIFCFPSTLAVSPSLLCHDCLGRNIIRWVHMSTFFLSFKRTICHVFSWGQKAHPQPSPKKFVAEKKYHKSWLQIKFTSEIKVSDVKSD